MARRAQREVDYEELAIALQRQYSVNVAPTAVPERAAPVPAAPAEHIVRPARVDDGTVKKQRQNSRKREAEKERKELLQEVGAAQQRTPSDSDLVARFRTGEGEKWWPGRRSRHWSPLRAKCR